ncbi:MAG: ADP-ribosylglycohydrolase family protein, partial [Phycisphaerae bacterium]
LKVTGSLDEHCATKVRQVPTVLGEAPPKAMSVLGDAWVGEEALADALYCFLRSPDEHRATVLAAANSNGDSDSIACIAGAMSDAFNGVEAIPERWRRGVENGEYLTDLAKRLHAASIAS